MYFSQLVILSTLTHFATFSLFPVIDDYVLMIMPVGVDVYWHFGNPNKFAFGINYVLMILYD